MLYIFLSEFKVFLGKVYDLGGKISPISLPVDPSMAG